MVWWPTTIFQVAGDFSRAELKFCKFKQSRVAQISTFRIRWVCSWYPLQIPRGDCSRFINLVWVSLWCRWYSNVDKSLPLVLRPWLPLSELASPICNARCLGSSILRRMGLCRSWRTPLQSSQWPKSLCVRVFQVKSHIYIWPTERRMNRPWSSVREALYHKVNYQTRSSTLCAPVTPGVNEKRKTASHSKIASILRESWISGL